MPTFHYTARNRDGKVVADMAEAESREALGVWLKNQRLLPTHIEEKRKHLNFGSLSAALKHVNLLEKLTFVKNLSVTLKAGLPVSRALAVVTKQMSNAYFSGIIADVAHRVEAGQTLSASLGAYPKIFSPIFVNMVKVGESSGDLEQTLEYLARQMARDYGLIRRTKGALTYPAVVVFALLIIGYLMFTFVLPKLTATFAEFDAELPVLTRVIISTVDIFSRYSILVALVFIALTAAFFYWRRTESGHRVIHKFLLIIPVFKNLTKKINLARFTIIFSGLLKSGMPIVEALAITGNTMTNVYYRQAILEAAEKVKVGVDLVAVLDSHPDLFTPMVTQMLQVGEESGTIEKVLGEVADFYETEIDDTVKNLSSIIEPLLVMVIGAVVGLLAVGLITPIYNISQGI